MSVIKLYLSSSAFEAHLIVAGVLLACLFCRWVAS